MRKKNKNQTQQNYTNTYTPVVQKSLTNFGSLSSKTEKIIINSTKGKKNISEFPDFINLCLPTQKELKEILPQKLIDAGYTDVVMDDGFIYAKGEVPVLLTAHMDTVHKHRIEDYYEFVEDDGSHTVRSPQGIGGDDRCGIYMILEIIKEHKCSVLFCEDEETGGIGSRKFCKTEFLSDLADMKYLIELDRMGSTDAVFYDCDNPDFTKFITDNTGYKKEFGSFSDISNLAPACGVAAVNLSCGYHHAHTTQEEVNVEEMLHTIEVVKELLTVDCEQFEYIEKQYSYYGKYGYGSNYGYGYGYGYGYDDDDDAFWDEYFSRKYNSKNTKDPGYEKNKCTILYVTYLDKETNDEKMDSHCGSSEEICWYNFFYSNPDICWNDVLDYEIDEI